MECWKVVWCQRCPPPPAPVCPPIGGLPSGQTDQLACPQYISYSCVCICVSCFGVPVCLSSVHPLEGCRTDKRISWRASEKSVFSAADLSVSPQRREIGIFQKKALVFRACFSAEEEKCPLRLAEENIHISSNKECFATGCREMRLPDKT